MVEKERNSQKGAGIGPYFLKKEIQKLVTGKKQNWK